MYQLVEATHPISDITGVPVEILIIAMLSVVHTEDAELLIETAMFFAPLRKAAETSAEGSSLVPMSGRYEHFLSLIERDNPQLYAKLRGLD